MRRQVRRWIGVDGEGVGRDPHRYVLLACSDGDYIEARTRLSTVDCLEFLLDLGSRDARVCGYYLGYDWTKILEDLTRTADGLKTIYMLFRPELRARSSGSFERVRYKQYELHWLAGAMWVRDTQDSGRKRKVTIWDLGKYFQGPFCKLEDGKLMGALPSWGIRPDVQAAIAAMKQQRSAFSARDMPRIRKYCLQECEALAELAGAIEDAHTDAGVKPRGWFGPGSTASVFLHRHDIRELRGHTPPVMLEAVASAFFGGRAEISTTGYVAGPVYGYDISSAYPYHASQLPCLVHGRWERVTRERAITGKGVCHALVHGDIRYTPSPSPPSWGPLPVRLPKGHIVFPRSGASGWWWRDEWLAAREGWKGLHFREAYVLRRECDCKPFSFIPELFAHRVKIGKETGAGKIIKLGLNSLYGKLSQTIGSAQFASRIWAGMITSGTRAQVLRLMLRHKSLDSVLMIATDGLFSTEAHDVEWDATAKTGAIVLGGWERAEHVSMTLVRSGIYWLDGAKILPFPKPAEAGVMLAKERSGRTLMMYRPELASARMQAAAGGIGGSKIRARGLGRDNLQHAKVPLATALHHAVDRVLLAPRVAFGGAKQCVYGPDVDHLKVLRDYGQWYERPTHVSLRPWPKRDDDWQPPTLSDVESAPYGTLSTRQQGEHFEFMEQMREYIEF